MTQKDLGQLREDARDIFGAALAAVDPQACIDACCRVDGTALVIDKKRIDLEAFERILVIGAGKAAAAMAAAVERLLKGHRFSGRVIVKYDHLEDLEHITIVEAAHPVPDENGVRGAAQLLELAGSADENTLVICLISGGGSALMSLPAPGLTLGDKQTVTRALLGCGATIHEINTIRKHLSAIKGGRLAKAVYPAAMACLILSDVVGDDLDIISSGPATADPGTFDTCLAIIEKYGITDQVPGTVMAFLEKGARGEVPETPKPGDPVFDRVSHTIVAANFKALAAAAARAEALGYAPLVLSAMIEGETRDVAGVHAAIARQAALTSDPVNAPACILSGGETTVTLKGDGKGGRNQEFVLAAAMGIQGLERVVVLSAGTDGTDGPTDAAGALADGTTIHRALSAGLDPLHHLDANNAYPFFDSLGDLIRTGATNTNVMDVRLVLLG